MGVFDKVKQGMADAGTKAKILVEVNRLTLQISQKEKEIDETFKNIGKSVFEAIQNNRLPDMEKEITPLCSMVLSNRDEIAQLEAQIKEVRNEKKCVQCSQSVTLDTKFCSNCGYKFQ